MFIIQLDAAALTLVGWRHHGTCRVHDAWCIEYIQVARLGDIDVVYGAELCGYHAPECCIGVGLGGHDMLVRMLGTTMYTVELGTARRK
jgi:hypothetical protein